MWKSGTVHRIFIQHLKLPGLGSQARPGLSRTLKAILAFGSYSTWTGTQGRMMSVLWRHDCLGFSGCMRLRGSRESEKPGLRWQVELG